ncbi:hypothetical protein U6A24_21015 [Aquimarina gracilis]|uniref:SMODS and SLOG-associating 2TM effector domain-containing protein n=1 Tax=Aquimarina gracilis TaxID=874422 RepID=A0ABU6A1H4_9FLAO|nr:hypothetical protein [Aquimarina gracilis]MEB3347969.1 hypothetical protein [Aquimarina gracilis]
MSVSINFNMFCEKLKVSPKKRSIISLRFNSICKKLNTDFWDINTNLGGIYVGCYGRETANDGIDKIEMIFEMPSYLRKKYSKSSKNHQFLFLEDVRRSIATLYPNTSIVNDEFGIDVRFFDGMIFNIAPVFYKNNNEHIYADPRKGGSWKTKNFKKEKEEVRIGDVITNNNLKRLCRMIKAWKHNCNVPIQNLLIDTLAHEFLTSWKSKDISYSYYDIMCRDFFKFLMNQEPSKKEWKTIGDFLVIPNTLNFRYKAVIAHYKAESAISFVKNNEDWLATLKWKEIFGDNFPGSVPVENQLRKLKDNVEKVYDVQKKCVSILVKRRLFLTILQITSAISIPLGLLLIEYSHSFLAGLTLFGFSTVLFVITLLYRRVNQNKIILKHKASVNLAASLKEQVRQILIDLTYNDVDIDKIRARKNKILSNFQSMYTGANINIGKRYNNAVGELNIIPQVRKKVMSSSNIQIPIWHQNKFSVDNHVQEAVNYKN